MRLCLSVGASPWSEHTADLHVVHLSASAPRYIELTGRAQHHKAQGERLSPWHWSKTDFDLGYIERSFAPSLLYVSLFDAFAPRNNQRSRRIASNKNRITSATAAAGAARA